MVFSCLETLVWPKETKIDESAEFECELLHAWCVLFYMHFLFSSLTGT